MLITYLNSKLKDTPFFTYLNSKLKDTPNVGQVLKTVRLETVKTKYRLCQPKCRKKEQKF